MILNEYMLLIFIGTRKIWGLCLSFKSFGVGFRPDACVPSSEHTKLQLSCR